MTVAKVLQSAQFVVDSKDRRQAVLLDISVWDAFLAVLEEAENEEAFLWNQVEETYAYRRQHPEDVITATAEEWLADTVRLDRSS